MDLSIYLYKQFYKPKNSTMIPGSTADYNAIYGVKLKEDTTFSEPTIILHLSDSDGDPANFHKFNYCRILEFQRYYYVKEWVISGKLLYCTLEVDALASFRSLIGKSEQYVLRSTMQRNTKIVDEMYPITNEYEYSVVESNVGCYDDYKSGFYIVGLISGREDTIGATSYYYFTNTTLRKFISKLYADTSWYNITFEELTEELFRSLVNPFQYITSCMYFPFSIPSDFYEPAHNIRLGWWILDTYANPLKNFIYEKSFSFPLTKHPQMATHGEYLLAEPYTQRTLYVPGFGDLPIHPPLDAGKIDFTVKVDLASGIAMLSSEEGLAVGKPGIIEHFTATWGIPIQLAQGDTGALSMAGSVLSSVGNLALGVATGASTATLLAESGSAIGSAIKSMSPTMVTKGSTGSIADFMFYARMVETFAKVVPSNLAKFGAPLCKTCTLSDLEGGFVQVSKACFTIEDFANNVIAPTSGEIDTITQMLESGCYLE